VSIILGIDPALTKTGWGVIDYNKGALKFIACGHIKTNDKHSLAERLAVLAAGVNKVIEQYKPDQAAVEETFISKGIQSALKLGQARGALILTIAQAGLPVAEYAANLVKKTVSGSGHAQKSQVSGIIKYLLPAALPKTEDEADALAVAITHALHSK
jgi:crossover junction endodeoxyribonuclease RuvC